MSKKISSSACASLDEKKDDEKSNKFNWISKSGEPNSSNFKFHWIFSLHNFMASIQTAAPNSLFVKHIWARTSLLNLVLFFNNFCSLFSIDTEFSASLCCSCLELIALLFICKAMKKWAKESRGTGGNPSKNEEKIVEKTERLKIYVKWKINNSLKLLPRFTASEHSDAQNNQKTENYAGSFEGIDRGSGDVCFLLQFFLLLSFQK